MFAFSNELGSSPRYFAAVLRQDAGWFDTASTGALTTKLTEYVLPNWTNRERAPFQRHGSAAGRNGRQARGSPRVRDAVRRRHHRRLRSRVTKRNESSKNSKAFCSWRMAGICLAFVPLMTIPLFTTQGVSRSPTLFVRFSRTDSYLYFRKSPVSHLESKQRRPS